MPPLDYKKRNKYPGYYSREYGMPLEKLTGSWLDSGRKTQKSCWFWVNKYTTASHGNWTQASYFSVKLRILVRSTTPDHPKPPHQYPGGHHTLELLLPSTDNTSWHVIKLLQDLLHPVPSCQRTGVLAAQWLHLDRFHNPTAMPTLDQGFSNRHGLWVAGMPSPVLAYTKLWEKNGQMESKRS